jgi:hypothetical protein
MLLLQEGAMAELRNELSRIVNDTDIQSWSAEFDALSNVYSLSIEIVGWHHDDKPFTCGAHALGLHNWDRYFAYQNRDLFADASFFEWLFKNGHLKETPTGMPGKPSLIQYFKRTGPQKRWTHIGRYTSDGRVESKWGKGLLLRHSVWETPSEYGEIAGTYRDITSSDARALFEKYVRGTYAEHCWKDIP